jgi:trans-aconitate 2-methyltransferase
VLNIPGLSAEKEFRALGRVDQGNLSGYYARAVQAGEFMTVKDDGMHPTPADIRSYYNSFLKSRMLAYRLYGNLRIESAARFFLDNISEDSTIVDIGCGIGIATETMAKKASRGRVIGVDISDENIWYASRTISVPNLRFHRLDIVNDAHHIKNLCDTPIDIFTLCDVIEHIPDADRQELFRTLSTLGSPDAKILLTIPSEWYQEYLRIENPGELQIVDNTITAKLLDSEAREAGFALTYFRLTDMWKKVQYAHCTLQRIESLNRSILQDVTYAKPSPLISFATKLANKIYFRRNRKKKYVDDVFGKH